MRALKGFKGKTTLMWATQNGRQNVVTLLLAQGADLQAQDKDGKTALDLAREYRQKPVEEILLKARAPAVHAGKAEEAAQPQK
jgi:ankyrin repeat protein